MSSASSTFTGGGNPTAVQVNGWAQGTLGYASVTANQTTITTAVDLTSLTSTFTVVAGRRIKITGHCNATSTVGTDGVDLQIADSSNVIVSDRIATLNAANQQGTATALAVLQLAAGTYTYKLRMSRFAGTGTITMVATSTSPAFILVEDIGAV